jgi:hypothetical protein
MRRRTPFEVLDVEPTIQMASAMRILVADTKSMLGMGAIVDCVYLRGRLIGGCYL